MILQVAPDAPVLIRAGAAAILYLHIGGGFASLASGAVAILSRKGERLHRAAGTVFFASMLLVSVIGGVVSPFLPQRIAAVAGGLAFYLVATAWLTVRRPEGRSGRLEVAAAWLAVAVAVGGAILGRMAQVSPGGELDGLPYVPAYLFAGFAALGAACDLKVIRSGGISGRRRITRHVWRMCVALLIATTSFVGQPKAFPPEWRGSPWLFAPVVVVLVLTIFWLVRARFTRAFEPAAPARPLAGARAA